MLCGGSKQISLVLHGRQNQKRPRAPVVQHKKMGVSTDTLSSCSVRRLSAGEFLACGASGVFLASARCRHSYGKLTHRCVVPGSFL